MPDEQDNSELELYLTDVGRSIDKWSEYKFNSHFLTPTDGFGLQVEGDALDPIMEDGLVPGASVQLRVAGHIQATGYLDSVQRSASRGSGVVWGLEGRDGLGQAVDGGIDPRTQFKETQTLEDLLLMVYEPFGFKAFELNVDADQAIKTGRPARKPRPPAKHPRKAKLPQLRPNNGEGAHEFASRVAKRFGYSIWPSADGTRLMIGKPDFEQDPTFTLIRRRYSSRENNILDATAKFDLSDQPSILITDGVSGGGLYGKSKLKCLMVNPAVTSPVDELGKISAAHPNSTVVYPMTKDGGAYRYAPQFNPRAKPLYLHDENSKTLEQLEEFTRREMMQRVRKSLTYSATVAGHGQRDGGGNLVPWTVDTVVDVQDEVTGVVEPMWILSRTFQKSRGSGTTTSLEMIRLYSLEI